MIRSRIASVLLSYCLSAALLSALPARVCCPRMRPCFKAEVLMQHADRNLLAEEAAGAVQSLPTSQQLLANGTAHDAARPAKRRPKVALVMFKHFLLEACSDWTCMT